MRFFGVVLHPMTGQVLRDALYEFYTHPLSQEGLFLEIIKGSYSTLDGAQKSQLNLVWSLIYKKMGRLN